MVKSVLYLDCRNIYLSLQSKFFYAYKCPWKASDVSVRKGHSHFRPLNPKTSSTRENPVFPWEMSSRIQWQCKRKYTKDLLKRTLKKLFADKYIAWLAKLVNDNKKENDKSKGKIFFFQSSTKTRFTFTQYSTNFSNHSSMPLCFGLKGKRMQSIRHRIASFSFLCYLLYALFLCWKHY